MNNGYSAMKQGFHLHLFHLYCNFVTSQCPVWPIQYWYVIISFYHNLQKVCVYGSCVLPILLYMNFYFYLIVHDTINVKKISLNFILCLEWEKSLNQTM